MLVEVSEESFVERSSLTLKFASWNFGPVDDVVETVADLSASDDLFASLSDVFVASVPSSLWSALEAFEARPLFVSSSFSVDDLARSEVRLGIIGLLPFAKPLATGTAALLLCFDVSSADFSTASALATVWSSPLRFEILEFSKPFSGPDLDSSDRASLLLEKIDDGRGRPFA